jgi:hypothetical protein
MYLCAQGDDAVIVADVPLNNMFGYSTVIRSNTQVGTPIQQGKDALCQCCSDASVCNPVSAAADCITSVPPRCYLSQLCLQR